MKSFNINIELVPVSHSQLFINRINPMSIDYRKQLVLHIQGLPFSTKEYFEDIDEVIPTSSSQVFIQKLGGYRPQRVDIIFNDKEGKLSSQAYMARYIEDNLVCSPIEDEVDVTVQPSIIPFKVYLVRLHIPNLGLSKEGWLSLHQEYSYRSTYEVIHRDKYVDLLLPGVKLSLHKSQP